MTAIQLFAVSGLVLYLFCSNKFSESDKHEISSSKAPILFLFGVAFLFRVIAAVLSNGFDSDTACFTAWAERVYTTGFSDFYSPDVFTDYPPGYIYVLYPIGALRSWLSIPYYSSLHLLLLRIPTIFCDLLSGFLVFHTANQRYKGTLLPHIFAVAYLFNPVVLLNSSVWGQVDSVYTFLLILICLCLCKGKTIPSYYMFFVGILIKPQMLFFAPVLFIGFLRHVILHDFSWHKFLWNLFAGLSALLLDLLLILPFGLDNVLAQYIDTVTSYPYAAVNACNFWGLLGQNWISQDTIFLGIPYTFYGYIGIAIFVILTFVYAFQNKNNHNIYPLLCSLLMSGIFVFSVRMHERYLYPAVILLLFACIFQPTKKIFLLYSGFSLFHFYNTAFVLFLFDPTNYDRRYPFLLIISLGTIFCLGFFIYTLFFTNNTEDLFLSSSSDKKEKIKKGKNLPTFIPSKQLAKLTKFDIIILFIIVALYSAFAFYDLGDKQVPETSIKLQQEESVDFVFVSDSLPRKLSFYTALPHNIVLHCYVSNAEEQIWFDLGQITLSNVFTWSTIDLPLPYDTLPSSFFKSKTVTYRFTSETKNATLLEFVFLNEQGNIVVCNNKDAYTNLFDEQFLRPDRSTFRNSMYFDEIYHARTAYEFLHGELSYENTHPPLGKVIISLGIKLFGMNPFGWRFMGTLFGVLMIPLMYLFGKDLFSSTPLAALSAFLYAFDFMHFTQSRIATIDVYISFFVILMYLFMYRYCKLSFYDRPLHHTFLPLGACGVAMGLGVATKWTGAYAGIGLAVIFFLHLYQNYAEAKIRLKSSANEPNTNNISWEMTFSEKCIKTILFCIVFFVIIPAIIYLLSYIPFRTSRNDNLLIRMLRSQAPMFTYHSTLEATHPFSSPWHEWPTMVRPIWYYSSIVTGASGIGGLREGISAFGNPLVWWVGIPALFYMFYLAYKKKDRTAIFLLIGYFAQYLPWMLVTRITFIYHYFPCVAFVVFMIVYSIKNLKNQIPKNTFYRMIGLYTISVFAFFLIFYPVLSGQPIDATYVINNLRWLTDWVFVAR